MVLVRVIRGLGAGGRTGSGGGQGLRFVSVDALPALAFDHAAIVAAAVARLRGKSSYSTLPFFLLPERFTLTELQHTYEAILQTRLEKSNFRRKMDAWGCWNRRAISSPGRSAPRACTA